MRKLLKTLQNYSSRALFGAVLAQITVDPNVRVNAAGLPILGFGSLLTFIIRLFFFIAGIAALIYGLWGALSWITSGGGKDEISAARDKIQAAIVGVFILVVVLSIIVAIEQLIFKGNICFGLTCDITIPGLEITPLPSPTP